MDEAEKNRIYNREYRKKNLKKIRENDAKYRLRNKEKIKAKDKRYMAENKEKRKITKAKYDANNKEKIAAYGAVANAVKTGKITKQPCTVCGDEQSQAHHEDYSKPLEVIWFCCFHHNQRHIELKELENEK